MKVSKDDRLYRIRHSLAHVLAQAVLEIRPGAKLAFGPPVDTGCYYDFLFDTPLNDEDLGDIQERMIRIIGENQPFEGFSLPAQEAVQRLEQRGEDFKVEYCKELIESGETEIGFYVNGPFEDMCAGPHVTATREIPRNAFTVDSLAGAYWRGDEHRPQLTRIYCLAFEDKKALQHYLKVREEARARDHRKLGAELDLFSIDHEHVGSGLILWHPNGGIVRHIIESHSRKRHLEAGYDFVYSPHIGRSVLWQTSGHLDFYKEGMYAPIEVDGQEYYLKPMNCPFHCSIYRSSLRSYRELPKRFAEWGTVYRYERSGTLHGLTRVRGFTQDDAHLFCREDQMPEEIDRVLAFSLSLLRDFGFKDFTLFLSTRPEQRVGEERKWDDAEKALEAALIRSGEQFEINPGDGAFYGPKIDLQVSDAIGRMWQLSTIQFDFNLPERFKLTYAGSDGKEHQPYMLHRALMGSIERFFAILIEHFGGAFPTWLAPVQVAIIPINEENIPYAKEVQAMLEGKGLRVALEESSESLNKKVRKWVMKKTPHLAVVGRKEADEKLVSHRRYKVEKQEVVPLGQFVETLLQLNIPGAE